MEFFKCFINIVENITTISKNYLIIYIIPSRKKKRIDLYLT